jgi:outer membrane assembly lipoprotein YfiO
MRRAPSRLARAGVLWLAVLAAGCGGPRTHRAPSDPRYEFEIGSAEFGRRHWVEAQSHLKRFLDLNPGHAVADSAQLLLALAKFESRSYAEAAVEFGILVHEFPRSALRDDASFHECRCYFEQMRPPQLDPTFAHRAQTCFREFLLRYSDSPHREAAAQHIQDIDDRLAEKDLRIGILFAKMNRPRAARVYLEAVLQNYPRSRWVPEALLWLARSLEKMGELTPAFETYGKLAESYPETGPGREARAIQRQLLDRYPQLRAGPTGGASPP